MNDIIHLLPDNVANQIAAGEVVQRPASVVKELLENAIDAGATQIELIIKDAGRTLIQVVDNGKGMSFSDARLCFERHATSKITSAHDLFSLTTKGFRGEALASIAAIAHVEMKTKRANDEMGSRVVVEGSEVKEHALDVCPNGTSFAIKNLFYNVPARRNFLKSDNIEFSHIEEELYRVALIHHNVAFNFYHNGKMVLQLPNTNFKQRICAIFGNQQNNQLFPVEQITENIKISGFISKPENTKKKKNNQYIFVNQRYISYYLLKYAIEKVYKELIPDGNKPAFFIQIEIDPAMVDFNISPTKTEVKFQEDKVLFGFLHAAVRKSIGSMSLNTQFDFDTYNELNMVEHKEGMEVTPPTIQQNPDFNPFNLVPAHNSNNTPCSTKNRSGGGSGYSSYKPSNANGDDFAKWSQMLDNVQRESVKLESSMNHEVAGTLLNSCEDSQFSNNLPHPDAQFLCIKHKYIATTINQELVFVDNELAWERILFERYVNALENAPIAVQQTLFPEAITLSPANAELAVELKHDLLLLGYDIEQVNHTQFCINGAPLNEEAAEAVEEISAILENYKSNQLLFKTEKSKNIARSMARKKCKRYALPKNSIEFASLIEQLSACKISEISIDGRPIVTCCQCTCK